MNVDGSSSSVDEAESMEIADLEALVKKYAGLVLLPVVAALGIFLFGVEFSKRLASSEIAGVIGQCSIVLSGIVGLSLYFGFTRPMLPPVDWQIAAKVRYLGRDFILALPKRDRKYEYLVVLLKRKWLK